MISPDVDYKYANIIIDGETIKSIAEKEVNPDNFDDIIEGEGLMALPGFIDEHTHGAVGFDTCDGKYESIDKIAEARLKEGVTMFLPTTLTMPQRGDPEILGGTRQGLHPHQPVSGRGTGAALHHEHLDGRRL